jgi:hypothetical protein
LRGLHKGAALRRSQESRVDVTAEKEIHVVLNAPRSQLAYGVVIDTARVGESVAVPRFVHEEDQ